MTRTLIHQKALTAAASVALAFGTGCWHKGPAPVDSGTPANQDSQAGQDDTGNDTGDRDTGKDSADTGKEDTGKEDTGQDDTGSTEAPSCLETEDLAACCEELSTWCADAYPDDTDEYNVCYYGEDFSGSTGCVPWGPPVPPKSQRSLA